MREDPRPLVQDLVVHRFDLLSDFCYPLLLVINDTLSNVCEGKFLDLKACHLRTEVNARYVGPDVRPVKLCDTLLEQHHGQLVHARYAPDLMATALAIKQVVRLRVTHM